MMYRPAKWGAVVALVLALCAGAARGQDAQGGAAGSAREPQEYGEYEAIPAPDIELYPDVPGIVPEDMPELPLPDADVGGEDAPSLEVPDAFMDEVNRQIEARRGLAPPPTGESPDLGRPDSTLYSLFRAFAWLLVVVALILLLYHFLQRRTRGGRLLTGNRLGTVLGRLYLNPRVCLHFVRTGGKVLVVGQTQSALSLIARFDEAEFAAVVEKEESEEGNPPAPKENPETGREFFSQLRANLAQMSRQTGDTGEASVEEAGASVDEDDIAELRGDIHRLQEYLRESTRGSED